MNVRANKVVRDLLGNRARTILVVAALAIGLIGLSTTLRSRAIFTTNLDAGLIESNAASAVLTIAAGDNAAVEVAAANPAVAEAVGRRVTFARVVAGDDTRPLRVVVLDDLSTAEVDRLRHEAGRWPPPTGTIALERSSTAAAGLDVGDIAEIVDPSGTRQDLTVSATTRDLTIVSGRLVDQVVFGYASVATWSELGLPAEFNEIAFTVVGDRSDEAHIGAVAVEVANDLSAAGYPVLRTVIPPPGKHVLDNVVSSLLLILGALGALSLLLSGFLVFNTVSAMLARQRPQIGVMKAVGATRRDVLALYLGTIGVLSVLSVLVAVPVGATAARLLTGELGTLLNIDIDDFGAPAWVWITELAVGLLVPTVAALAPILAGTRVTVAEAIRGADAGVDFGSSRLAGALARLPGLPMAFRYAARNTFRRKARLVLTVVALSLGGAILVTVLTLQSSLVATVDSVAAYWKQDVTVDLQQPLPADALVNRVEAIPGVVRVEPWLTAASTVIGTDGRPAAQETIVFGVPPATPFIEPTLTAGRWLAPGSIGTAVINVDVEANEPDLGVGDRLTLRVGGVDLDWEIVGVATTQLVAPGEPRPAAPIVYVAYDELDQTLGGGLASRLVVSGSGTPAEAQTLLSEAIDRELSALSVPVQSIETRERLRGQVERLTTPILLLLAAMAVLFAIVGGLGLLGTMSLNVLERTTEFGMVRAVGANSRTVLSIVLVEGLTVAALSWVVGSLLAVPLGWVMAQQVGEQFINVPLDFRFAPLGLVLWLIMAVFLAVIASWLPARNASRLSVRDAIAYE